MNNEWAGVVAGMFSAMFVIIILQICLIAQLKSDYDKLHRDYEKVCEKVAEHDEVIDSYKFYNWHNMKFFEEKEKR